MWSRLLLPLLYAFQVFLNACLAFCLNQYRNLTREQVHNSFVDIAYFESRLQTSEFATNFASYLIFWLGLHATPDPDPFYGRIVKAVVMACCAPIVYLLLHHRFQQSGLFSLLTSIDCGLEKPIELLALLLASFGNPWAGALLARSTESA